MILALDEIPGRMRGAAVDTWVVLVEGESVGFELFGPFITEAAAVSFAEQKSHALLVDDPAFMFEVRPVRLTHPRDRR